MANSEIAQYYDTSVAKGIGVTGAGLIWLMGRDHLSPSYDNRDEIALHANQWRTGASERILRLISAMGVEKGNLVLDIGTGIGGPGRDVMEQTACTVIGANISFRQLQSLRQLSDLVSEKSFIDVAQADGQQLPFPHASFSHVYSINMFYHIPRPERMISEVARVLKSGGRFGLDDWFLSEKTTVATHNKLRYEWSSPQGFHQYNRIVSLLHTYGFIKESEIDTTQEAAAFLTEERFGKTFDEQVRPQIITLFPQLFSYSGYEESHAVMAAQQLRDAIMYMGDLYRDGQAVYKQIIMQKI